jgi:hypothetical protein
MAGLYAPPPTLRRRPRGRLRTDRGDVGCYSFIAVDFHNILLASLPAHSLTLRPAGLLNRLKRPLSRGSGPAGYPAEPLVSYQINRQLSGWNLPPLVIRAFGAHCQQETLHRSDHPLYSITPSARVSSVGGNWRPSALAVLRLTNSWNWSGSSAGISLGEAPLINRRIVGIASNCRPRSIAVE